MNNPHQLNRRAFIVSATGASLAVSVFAGTPASARKFRIKASQVRALALTDDKLAVVAADRSLLFHRLSGEFVREISTSRPVRAVCTGAHGDLIITFSDQVARVTAGGEIQMIGERMGQTQPSRVWRSPKTGAFSSRTALSA